jgi:hypothetical protein
MRLHRAALLLAVSTVLPACGQYELVEPREIGSYCTLEARPSVRVTVVDTQGRPWRGARVTYTAEGGPEQQAQCLGSNQAESCEQWWAGTEKPGLFVITAISADGQLTVQQQVTVTETPDNCHVITETVQLTLPN